MSSQPSSDTNKVSIVNGATTLGDKAYESNPLRIKVGSTVVWTNNDNIIHTVTSGTPNAANVGEAFDSGLTAFITPAKTYSHKFTDARVFLLSQETSYNDRKDYCCSLCRVRPVEMFEISVSEELE